MWRFGPLFRFHASSNCVLWICFAVRFFRRLLSVLSRSVLARLFLFFLFFQRLRARRSHALTSTVSPFSLFRWLEPCLSVVNISSSAQCLADGAAAVLPASSLAEWTGKAEPSLHARCDHAHPVARDGSVAPSAGGNFRIIPSAAFCDLCIRLVPSQNPVAVFLALKRYVEALFRDMQSEHQVYVHLVGHGQGWKTNRQSHSAKELFSAAHQAIQEVGSNQKTRVGAARSFGGVASPSLEVARFSRREAAPCAPRSDWTFPALPFQKETLRPWPSCGASVRCVPLL